MTNFGKSRCATVLFFLSGNTLRKKRMRWCVILYAFMAFFGVSRSSGQDLGALARQEQARKEAQPVNRSHVYTNDDMVRPRILVPEDKVVSETERQPLSPSLLEQPPVAESSAPEVSLGEIARQYRKQKLAQKAHAQTEARSTIAAHIYTNEDMVHDKILMLADRVLYEAALEKAGTTVIETRTEIAPNELARSEAPLGDLARVAYQRRERVLEAHEPSRVRFPESWTSPASQLPWKRSVPGTPKIAQRANQSAARPAEQQLDELRNSAFEVITVRSGDSLWKLARLHLGQGIRWHALLRTNPGIRNPNHLRIGSVIRI
jgi:hypothetical protein